MEITGIILAGGKSSRMGTDKGLQLLSGKPMISYGIELLSPFCKEILISSSSDGYHSFGCKVVADVHPGIGPMGGIYSALIQSKTSFSFVLSCDLPFVSKELVSFIIRNSEGFKVAVPWFGSQHYEPLCGMYHSEVVADIERFIRKGNYKLPDMFAEVPVNKLSMNEKLSFYSENLFMNVNSKQELEAAREWFKNRNLK